MAFAELTQPMMRKQPTDDSVINKYRAKRRLSTLDKLPALTTLRFLAGRAAFGMLAILRATATLTWPGLAARGPFEPEQSGRGPQGSLNRKVKL